MGLFGMFSSGKSYLIRWQNAVCVDKSSKLFMTEKQLEQATIQAVNNDIRIFDDCSRIINTTISPKVFFSRLELAEERLVHLSTLEPYMTRVKKIKIKQAPTKMLHKFRTQKQEYIKGFIKRYHGSVTAKARGLKTEKSKENQYQKFYDSLTPYFDVMNQQNISLVEKLGKK